MIVIDDYIYLKDSEKFLSKIDSIVNKYNSTRVRERITISNEDFIEFLADIINEFTVQIR